MHGKGLRASGCLDQRLALVGLQGGARMARMPSRPSLTGRARQTGTSKNLLRERIAA